MEQIEGQCGTCAFAAKFGYADSPSGPEDGVHCTSKAQAEMIDDQTRGDTTYRKEFEEYGYIDVWRLENLVDPDYKCPNWKKK